jgi:hypothetical protein
MLTCKPGADTGYLGYAIADALIDLLVEKGVINRADALGMLHDLHYKLAKDISNAAAQRSAKHLADGIPQQ